MFLNSVVQNIYGTGLIESPVLTVTGDMRQWSQKRLFRLLKVELCLSKCYLQE